MPNYVVHFGVSFIVYCIFFFVMRFSFTSAVVYFFVTIVFGLLPDIDIGTSKLGKLLRIFLVISALLLLLTVQYALALFVLLFLLILLLSKHRGFFHTIRAGLLFSLPLLLYSVILFVFGFFLYFLHLVLDRHVKM
ncbi:MAG: metal-dependent hydrolase [Candidatus Woesearchaeota archaeon]